MWWMKLIGSLCVCVGCLIIGMEKSRELSLRIRKLREMIQGLILFKGFTSIYRLPLENVCEKISRQTEPPVSEFYQILSEEFRAQGECNSERIWKKTVKCMGKAFDKEDQMLFLRLGIFLGVQDLRLQGEALDNCIEQVRQRVEYLERERPEKEKLYHVLTFTVSGFLILLFI